MYAATPQPSFGRMPSLRRYDVAQYNGFVLLITELMDRFVAARKRYLDAMAQLATAPSETKMKLVAVSRKKLEIDQTLAKLRSVTEVVMAALQEAAETNQETVAGVSSDVASSFQALPALGDQFRVQVEEFEGMVNDLLSGLGVTAADVAVSPEISERAPKAWTEEDLQLLQRFRNRNRRVNRSIAAINRFYQMLSQAPDRPWSIDLSRQVQNLYELFERGDVRELLAELRGPTEVVERPVSEHAVHKLGVPPPVMQLRDEGGLAAMVEQALRLDLVAQRPLSPETKDLVGEYMDRTTTLAEVADEAETAVQEMERESRPVTEWSPTELKFHDLRQQYAEARTKKLRNEISEDDFNRIEEAFEQARQEYEQFGDVEKRSRSASIERFRDRLHAWAGLA
jgi:hypothetical protein